MEDAKEILVAVVDPRPRCLQTQDSPLDVTPSSTRPWLLGARAQVLGFGLGLGLGHGYWGLGPLCLLDPLDPLNMLEAPLEDRKGELLVALAVLEHGEVVVGAVEVWVILREAGGPAECPSAWRRAPCRVRRPGYRGQVSYRGWYEVGTRLVRGWYL